MNVFKWLFKPFLEGKVEKEEKKNTGYYEMDEDTKASISLFAKYIAVDYIASCLSKLPIQTIYNGKEQEADLFYILNYRPNASQNASDFFYEFWFQYLWYGEVLAFEQDSQWFVADSFTKADKDTKALYFESVSYGNFSPNRRYSIQDVIYMGDAWEKTARSDTLLSNVLTYCNEMLSIASKVYSKFANEKYFLEVQPLATGEDYEKKFQEMMNVSFKNFLNSDKAVLPLIGGITAKSAAASGSTQGNKSMVTEIKDTMLLAIENAARKYRIPVTLLVGGNSDVSDVMDLFISECLCFYTKKAEIEFTSKLYQKKDILNNSKIVFDTSKIKHRDLFDCASSADKLRAASIANVNEIRDAMGLSKIDEPWAEAFVITKNYSDISSLKGGGTNG